jgi:hypothetical protein
MVRVCAVVNVPDTSPVEFKLVPAGILVAPNEVGELVAVI